MSSNFLIQPSGLPSSTHPNPTMMERVLTALGIALAVVVFMSVFLAGSIAYSQTRGVTIEGKNPAQFVKAQSGKAWAVVIGINAYQHAPRLSYAVADAQSMEDLLTRQGFSVVSFYDEQATRQAILTELGDHLPTMVGELDRVVVFFAGHGETRQFGRASTMGYLLPVEAQQTALSATAIDMGVIRTWAQALPAKHMLFLIDVCYGGIAGQRFRSLSPMTAEYVRVITREKGRQLITAGGSDQQAIESPEWGHSAFTYFLLKGLGEGLADINGDGIIPTSELYSYLDQRVYTTAQLVGHTQRPELWRLSADQGEFVFFPPSTSLAAEHPSVILYSAEPSNVTSLRQELEALQSQVQALSRVQPSSPPITTPSLLVEGDKKEKELPTIKAEESLESQCEQGNGEMCFRLASQYVLGSQIPQNIEKGASLLEEGCRTEHLDSCTALGSLLWLGKGVPQNKNLALSLWKFACKRGHSKACSLLGKNKSFVG